VTGQAQAFLDRIAQDDDFRTALSQHLGGLSGTERAQAAIAFAQKAGYAVTQHALDKLLASQRGEPAQGDANGELSEDQLARVAGGFFYHNNLLW